jgi:hypothetical protein
MGFVGGEIAAWSIGRQPYLNGRSFHHGKYDGMPLVTFMGNRAGRFSRKAVTPSFTSSDLPRA